MLEKTAKIYLEPEIVEEVKIVENCEDLSK